MTTKTTLKAAIAGAALTLAVAAQAEAATEFGTLAGIEAEPMNAAEMEATQGKNLGIFSPPINDPLTAFNAGIAAQLGVTPAMVNAFFPGVNATIGNAFSQGATMYDGINTINALISGASGGLMPFVPVGSPFPANFPAASSSNLNLLLGLAGQPGLPMLPGF